MAKLNKRFKAAAALYAAQSKPEVIAGIKQLGDIQRELIRTETEMNDQIAVVTQYHSATIEQLKAKRDELQTGIQTWCEVNRDELTQGGKIKTANLTTGEVQWRIRPPACVVRGTEATIEILKHKGLERFIRIKEEVNKDAILNEPNAVKNIPGIAIKTGVEDFAIIPFEQEV